LKNAPTRGGALFPPSMLDVGNDIMRRVSLEETILESRQEEQQKHEESGRRRRERKKKADL
jgi:hypothetical protein